VRAGAGQTAAEEQRLEDKLKNFKYFPVANIGIRSVLRMRAALRWVCCCPGGCASAPTSDEYPGRSAYSAARPEREVLRRQLRLCGVPTIGKGGWSSVARTAWAASYAKGAHVGDATVTQLSVACSSAARLTARSSSSRTTLVRRIHPGEFEFRRAGTAVAITAGASAQATTGGPARRQQRRRARPRLDRRQLPEGMRCSPSRRRLMYEASLGGQKFGYKPQ